MDEEVKDDIIDVIEVKVTEFDEKEYEEIELLGDKKFKFYEKMRGNIDKWTRKKTGKAGYEVTQFILLLPDLFMLISRLLADKRVPVRKKLFLAGVVAYVMSPLDIIPDFIPFFGYTDDLFLVLFSLDKMLNEVAPDVVSENWSGEENVIDLVKNLLEKSNQFIDKNVVEKVKKWARKKDK